MDSKFPVLLEDGALSSDWVSKATGLKVVKCEQPEKIDCISQAEMLRATLHLEKNEQLKVILKQRAGGGLTQALGLERECLFYQVLG
jgi:hypothetical protein